ncbi:MAG: glycosyltransferase [Candidatus Bathyarchaeia archaeon]
MSLIVVLQHWLLMSTGSKMVQGISVVTTTWNEKENIEELILRARSVLESIPHEIIVVDDSSSDGTVEVAEGLADVAVSKVREGQTKGLLYGMKLSKFPIIVTIDADLENDPELIPVLVRKLGEVDLVVASRTVIPRFSERVASKTLGKMLGVSDFYSNFRAYKKEAIDGLTLKGEETFGGELLVRARKRGFVIGEVKYEAPPRRNKPRIGGTIRANFRIMAATLKCLLIFAV